MNKEFPIEVVLSSIYGVLLCDIGQVYECLNFLFGTSFMTHQLPKASEQARPHVLRGNPELANINLDDVTPENWKQRVNDIHKYFGETVWLDHIEVPYQGGIFSDLAEMRISRALEGKI